MTRRRRFSLTGGGTSGGDSKVATTASRRHSTADNVLAATAGLDNWKTWAGRQHGTDDFEFMDLFRGMKRTITHKMFSGTPPPGTSCPVCFCEPDEWHVTSSCSHAVCVDCLKAYASNQVRDKEQSGPLKCPVCPQVLRRSDAVKALGGDRELIRLWDLKIRNQLLRALPAFRSCPHCTDTTPEPSSTSVPESTGGGGGFVTPECLGPHYQERRETAKKILYGLPLVSLALLALWILMVTVISKTPSSSALIDLLFMMIPIYTFVRAGQVAHGWVAQAARRAFLRPISVECPCCDKAFILPAESKELQDEETSRWMDANTRPCPSCSVPIHKDGGCNHMRCGHCHANFCWACMRLRTRCAAYTCRNGAPFKNAVPIPGVNGDQAPTLGGDNVLAIIDYILDRERPQLDLTDGMIVFYSMFIRHFGPLQQLAEFIMALIATLITSGVLTGMVAIYVSVLTWQRVQAQAAHHAAVRAAQGPAPPRQRNQHGNLTASELLLGIEERNALQRHRNVRDMTEQEMIAEATRRSMFER